MNINPSDLALYLNIAFFSALGIGLLIGLLKGFRRSLYTFIITLIFIGVFFLTVNAVVSALYTMNLSFLGGLLANVDSSLSSATSVQEAVRIYLPTLIGDQLDTSFTNPDFWAFIDSMGMFVLKIVYTVLYFTVIQFIYRFILFIIGLFVFRKGRAKNKKGKRNRPLGAVFGTLTAALNLFVMIIVLSGVISIADSFTSLNIENLSYQVDLDVHEKPNIVELNQSLTPVGRLNVKPFAEENPGLDQAIDDLRNLVEVYQNNVIIQGIDAFKVEDEVTGEEKNAAILLFDEVLSINYKNQTIGLREDLRTFSQLANIYLTSEFYDTNNIGDFTSDEITNMFVKLSQSKLLTNLIPVAIEVGVDFADIDLEIDKEFLYETVNWQDEIEQIGVVVSTGFIILENAQAFDGEVDMNTVSLNGGQVKLLFDELASSRLAEYGAYIAVEQVLTNADSVIQSVIQVPDDIDWSAEFQAFGLIADELLIEGLTLNDLQNQEPQDILLLFSDVDLTVLLNSKITRRAMINILSGNSELEFEVDFLVIPDLSDEEWYDELSGEGELRNILVSLNILVNNVGEIDFDNFQISDISTISDEDIDEMFESQILVASITELIKELDTGDFNLIIPDSVIDSETGYIIKEEVKRTFSALTMLAGAVPCDPGDTACEELGFDIDKVTDLDSDNINTLFNSEILFATTSYLLIGFEELVVPDDVKIDILVEGSALTIIEEEEIKRAFSAISALGISNIQNLQVDESILLNLSVDPDTDPTTLDTSKTAALFASKILHATISYFIIDQTDVTPPETSPVVIPFFASENYEDTDTNIVRYDDAAGNVTYISQNELTNILRAVLVLDITDFTAIDSIDFSTINTNIDVLLDSAILHATVSDQIIQLSDSDTLTIPQQDVDSNDIIVVIGDTSETETTYVAKTELISVIDALNLLDIQDINNVSIDTIDLGIIFDNISSLLDSAILHATLSKQIIDQADAGSLVVPYRDLDESLIRKSVGPSGEEVEYIIKQEIEDTLNALNVLEINDINNVNIDTSILSKLSIDPDTDPTTLDTNKSDALLDSKIVHSTISRIIFDAGEPDEITGESQLIVPYTAYENYASASDSVRYITTDDDQYIVEDELTELFRMILLLDISDFSDVNSITLATFTPHKNVIFNSAILHATISDQVIELSDTDSLVVPSLDTDNQALIVNKGDAGAGEDTDYVLKDELIAVITALDTLEIDDFNNVNIDTTILQRLSVDPVTDPTTLDTDKSDDLLASRIIHATISKLIFDAGEADETTGESDLIIPYQATENYASGSNDVRFISNDGDQYIVKDELTELFRVILVLDLTDFASVGGLTLDQISAQRDIIFNSSIIHATFSNELIQLGNDGSLVVPNADLSDQAILISTGDPLVNEEVEFIVKQELKDALYALEILDIGGLDSVAIDASILLNLAVDPVTDPTTLDTTKSDALFDSKIVHATISKVIFDAGEADETTGESDLIVPHIAAEAYLSGSSDVRASNASSDNYIVEEELTQLFEAVLALNISDFTSVSSLTLTDIIDNQDTLLGSAIIHATISKRIFDLEVTNPDIIIPEINEASESIIFTDTVASIDYLIKEEVSALFEAVQLVSSGDNIEDFGGSVDLTIFFKSQYPDDYDTNQETLFSSSIMKATVSKQIFDLETTTTTIIIPDYNQAGDSIVIPDNEGDNDAYLIKDELKAMFNALDLVTDSSSISSFDGAIDLSVFFASENPTDYDANQDTLLSSSIMQATVSLKLSDLEVGGTVVIPSHDVTNASIEVTHGTDYFIYKHEIKALINVMDVVGFTSIESFDGVINLSVFSSESNQDILLSSAIMHRTVSKQLLDNSSIIVPEKSLEDDLSNLEIRILASTNEYILASEIKILLDVMNLVSSGSVDSIDTNFSLSTFDSSTTTGSDNQILLLSSAIMHATISDQVLDLDAQDSLVAPNQAFDTTQIRYTIVGDTQAISTDYIIRSEIGQLIDGLNRLGLGGQSLGSFDGALSITTLADPTVQTDVFASSIMHATLSEQILLNASVVVPEESLEDDLGNTQIRYLIGSDEYILEDEIIALIDVMDIISSGNVNDFSGSFSLSTFDSSTTTGSDNQTTLLSSAIMHATISDQILDLDAQDTMVAPHQAFDTTQIRYTVVGSNQAISTNYVIRSEVGKLIDGLNRLGLGGQSLDSFDGALSISTLADPTVQTDVFASSIMHATLSDQILSNASLKVPEESLESNLTNVQVRYLNGSDEYILKEEIIALIDVMDIISSGGNVTGFSANISLSTFDSSTTTGANNQTTLLASAIMHATISDQVLDLDADSKLITPTLYFNSTTIRHTVVGSNQSISTEFIIKSEIGNLIDGLNTLGLGGQSLSAFDGTLSISSLSNESDQDDVLSSATLHATFSDKLLGLNDDVLFVPTYTQDGEIADNQIKLSLDSITYITKEEVKAIINAFIDMGYDDLDSFSAAIQPSEFFDNITLYLESASIHATLSNKIYAGSSTSLILPERDINDAYDVKIIQTDITYLEKQETINLINALNILGISDFDSSISGSALTGLDETQLNTILDSGTMHLSIEDIIQGNGNIASDIPNKALADLFALTDILIRDEVINFILASKAFAGEGSDITSVDFSTLSIASLQTMPESQRNTILASMIVRNILTPDIEQAASIDPGFTLQASDYEDNLTSTFLTSAGIIRYLDYLNTL